MSTVQEKRDGYLAIIEDRAGKAAARVLKEGRAPLDVLESYAKSLVAATPDTYVVGNILPEPDSFNRAVERMNRARRGGK